MDSNREVTLERDGRSYGATYQVEHGTLHRKTHTETRSVDLRDRNPAALAREVLREIVDAQGPI